MKTFQPNLEHQRSEEKTTGRISMTKLITVIDDTS